jgi:hypothetical protein
MIFVMCSGYPVFYVHFYLIQTAINRFLSSLSTIPDLVYGFITVISVFICLNHCKEVLC